jgi:hypothetical protein
MPTAPWRWLNGRTSTSPVKLRTFERSGPSFQAHLPGVGSDEEVPPLETLRGKRTANVVPSASVDFTLRLPPCASTICDAMYSPKPRPVVLWSSPA